MDATNYTNIGPVLQLNKDGELTQKRIKAVKVCDGLYISEPDKRDFVRYIIECNGVMWVEDIQHKSYAPKYAAAMPKALERVKSGFYGDERFNDYRHEIDCRVNHPDSPAIMELKKPERKKPAPLAENERKVGVLMFKGCTDEMTEKKVVITEVAPHVYTYTYNQKRYGERVKIIFEINGVYFQGHDTGTYVLEREDFTEVCAKAYEHARDNVADGVAKGVAYFIEVQKRIDAATPTETPQISTETATMENVSVEAEKESIKHISEIMETCRTWDNEKRDYTDEYKYYTWLANHIPEHKATNKNTTELILEEVRERISAAATLAAHGVPKCDIEGVVCAVVNRLAKMEDILQFYNLTEPPQSPETPQTAKCTTLMPGARETARKRANKSIGRARHLNRPRLCANGYTMLDSASAVLAARNVRRECSTANSPPYW